MSTGAEADRLAASGDLAGAAALLQQLAAAQPDDIGIWLKLAGVLRARGDLVNALNSVHRALAVEPLNFTALLLRASLLHRMDNPEAGEAWGQALAQKPETDLPLQLSTVVAQAEQHHAAWVERKEARLREQMASAERAADPDERHNIERF